MLLLFLQNLGMFGPAAPLAHGPVDCLRAQTIQPGATFAQTIQPGATFAQTIQPGATSAEVDNG